MKDNSDFRIDITWGSQHDTLATVFHVVCACTLTFATLLVSLCSHVSWLVAIILVTFFMAVLLWSSVPVSHRGCNDKRVLKFAVAWWAIWLLSGYLWGLEGSEDILADNLLVRHSLLRWFWEFLIAFGVGVSCTSHGKSSGMLWLLIFGFSLTVIIWPTSTVLFVDNAGALTVIFESLRAMLFIMLETFFWFYRIERPIKHPVLNNNVFSQKGVFTEQDMQTAVLAAPILLLHWPVCIPLLAASLPLHIFNVNKFKEKVDHALHTGTLKLRRVNSIDFEDTHNENAKGLEDLNIGKRHKKSKKKDTKSHVRKDYPSENPKQGASAPAPVNLLKQANQECAADIQYTPPTDSQFSAKQAHPPVQNQIVQIPPKPHAPANLINHQPSSSLPTQQPHYGIPTAVPLHSHVTDAYDENKSVFNLSPMNQYPLLIHNEVAPRSETEVQIYSHEIESQSEDNSDYSSDGTQDLGEFDFGSDESTSDEEQN